MLTAALVWITWIVTCIAAIGVGLLALRAFKNDTSLHGPAALRTALWWGISGITLIVLTWNLLAPLTGPGVSFLVSLLALVSAIGWIVNARRVRTFGRVQPRDALLVAGLLIASWAMAYLALGIPINYDTGLYHLGSINYAHDYGTVPGLANLHDRFGFNSSVYPLAAFLSNGLWAGEGFRLIVGVLLTAMAIDLSLRLIGRQRQRLGVSTLALTLGLTITWVFVLQVAGDQLASPTADTIVVILVVISSVYLLEAVGGEARQSQFAAVAVVTAALAGTVRPLNWLYCGLVLVTVLVVLNRRWHRATMWGSIIFSFVLFVVMLARDAVLSGWLLFPLSLLPMPVDWRYPTPEQTSTAISAWAKAPQMPFEFSASGWQWLGPWLQSLTQDWYVLALVGLIALFLVLAQTGRRLANRLYWAAFPAVAVLPVWWITAPDPRFAWGQMLAAGVVPVAIALDERPLERVVTPVAGILLILAVIAAGIRGEFATVAKDVRPDEITMGPFGVELFLGPTIDVRTLPITVSDGTITIEPESEQCWNDFPLCRPSGSPKNIESRGERIKDGFRPTDP